MPVLPFHLWEDPFYEGSVIAEDIGALYDIGIDGHGYLVDPGQCERRFVKQLRPSFADSTAQPGEHILNPETAMRRSSDQWNHGAGQTYLDDQTVGSSVGSDEFRFRSSLGVDVWERGQLTLLPTTCLSKAAASPGSIVRAVSGVDPTYGVYLSDDDGTTHAVYRSLNPLDPGATWTACTGLVGRIWWMATDGRNVYVVAGAAGATKIYVTDMGGTTPTVFGVLGTMAAGEYTGCAYANGRLIAWGADGRISEIAANGTATLILAHRLGVQWTWVQAVGAPNATYLLGYTGQSTEIYRVDVRDATGTLSAPILAGTIYAEQVQSAVFNAGFLILGLGVNGGSGGNLRVAQIGANGGLTVGPAIVVGNTMDPVHAVEAAGKYVFFSWCDYDPQHTGLARMDMTQSTDSELVFAYATDIMAGRMAAPTQGFVRSAVHFGDKRLFTVDGSGIWMECDASGGYTHVGQLTSGRIRYGMFDLKAFATVDVAWDPLPPGCSVKVEATFDDGSSVVVCDIDADDSTGVGGPMSLPHETHQWMELTVTLRGPAGVELVTPLFRWWIVRAVPATGAVEQIIMCLRLHRTEMNSASDVEAVPLVFDVDTEVDFLRQLARTGRVVRLQRGQRSEDVYVQDVYQKHDRWSQEKRALEGLVFVEMHTLE